MHNIGEVDHRAQALTYSFITILREEVSRKRYILVFSKKRIPPHLSLTAIDGVSCSIIMKCDGAREILAATGLGAETSAEMKKFIKKHERNPRKSWECERMRAAIPYLEKIGM